MHSTIQNSLTLIWMSSCLLLMSTSQWHYLNWEYHDGWFFGGWNWLQGSAFEDGSLLKALASSHCLSPTNILFLQSWVTQLLCYIFSLGLLFVEQFICYDVQVVGGKQFFHMSNISICCCKKLNLWPKSFCSCCTQHTPTAFESKSCLSCAKLAKVHNQLSTRNVLKAMYVQHVSYT